VTITPAAEATGAAKPALSKGQLVALKPPRLPYHEAVEERFGIDRAGWKALVEAIYPNAETADAIVMALSYCRARNLDPFKRPVHIVPMWSSVAGKMIETVWPGISELRTTAFRTGQYAGMPAPKFGPTIERTFKGKAGRGKSKGQERRLTLQFPEWCRVTITRELTGKERSFVGPKVYWCEAYANGPTPMCRTKCGRTVRSAHPRWRGPRPGKAEAGKRHAPECRRGAQASPAARVATTAPDRIVIGRASRTVRRPARRRSRNPRCPRARV
jgi:RecT family